MRWVVDLIMSSRLPKLANIVNQDVLGAICAYYDSVDLDLHLMVTKVQRCGYETQNSWVKGGEIDSLMRIEKCNVDGLPSELMHEIVFSMPCIYESLFVFYRIVQKGASGYDRFREHVVFEIRFGTFGVDIVDFRHDPEITK